MNNPNVDVDNEEEEEYDDDEIKAILIGETGTGKTSLINTSIGLEFKEKLESTQSSSIIQKTITINDKSYTINLWDTIGQEQYRALNKIFMKGAKIVIFVYDITRLETFQQLDFWFKSTKEVLGNKPIMGIIGNKSDLYYQEAVNENVAEEYAKKKGVPFSLASAKTPKVFCDFLEELVLKYIQLNEGNIKKPITKKLKINYEGEDEEKINKKKKCC